MKKRNLLLVTLSLLASCGKEGNVVSVTTFDVPSSLMEERTDHQGMIETISYTTRDYVNNSGKTQEKKANVYLPFSYEPTKQYNVLYLLHGTDMQSVDHINTWFKTIGMKNILDNMIYQGVIDPLIVVAPTFYSYGLYGDDNMSNITEMTPVKQHSSDNFGYELRNDIIPTVENKYSTYASDIDSSGLKESRNHRAMAGLSNGARITLKGGLMQNFDYISSFGCYSSSWDAKEITQALNKDEYKGLNLTGFYNASGIYDFAYNAQKKMYDELQKDERFTSDNCQYFKISFGYHSARSWRVGLYDTLQYLFKEAK